MVFVVQLTFFSGCLVLDERRRIGRRFDLLPCIHSQQPDEPSKPKIDQHGMAATGHEGISFRARLFAHFADFILTPTRSAAVIATHP